MVDTEITPNPDTLKFLPGKKVSEIGKRLGKKLDELEKIRPEAEKIAENSTIRKMTQQKNNLVSRQ